MNPSAVIVGNFDGVHKGHQRAATMAVETARERGLTTALLTFQPHPAAVVGAGAPPVLTPPERKAELVMGLGVDRVFEQRFDSAFALWKPERFAADLLEKALGARVVVVGENFRFGAQRGGDLACLRDLGLALGFEVLVCPLTQDARGPFSSTRARTAVQRGDLEDAQATLGRPHAIAGRVVRGDQRGRTIGFPTANLDEVVELLPRDGVYAVTVDELDAAGEATALGGGVMNVGVRPTVAHGLRRTVETHLFDLDADLYGRRLRAHLVRRLRDERRFDGLEALMAQIAEDARLAREALAAHSA